MIIAKVIRRHGYTIEQVAEQMGIRRGTLANMIGGNVTVGTLQRIADVIGCNRMEFFADEGQEGQKPSGHVCPYCGHELHVTLE